MHQNDEKFMKIALLEAKKAAAKAEVPVGAVVVVGENVVAKAHNRKEEIPSPLGHAELLALHKAALKLGRWRLSEATLYVTLEPCVMCAAALWQARIGRVVFGAFDSKAGGVVSLYQIGEDQRLNHRYPSKGGVLEAECQIELKNFFKTLRSRRHE
ncbi:MAG: nucleoside deaminase [Proteobacteria bacterium]|jgi:tRNA(adenine34) deaminase|nr:nucleoside deaminase [Pseudomonadota bacterium]